MASRDPSGLNARASEGTASAVQRGDLVFGKPIPQADRLLVLTVRCNPLAVRADCQGFYRKIVACQLGDLSARGRVHQVDLVVESNDELPAIRREDRVVSSHVPIEDGD